MGALKLLTFICLLFMGTPFAQSVSVLIQVCISENAMCQQPGVSLDSPHAHTFVCVGWVRLSMGTLFIM